MTLGAAAHGLANLIGPILLASEILIRKAEYGDNRRELIEQIHRCAERAGALVKQISALSRASEARERA